MRPTFRAAVLLATVTVLCAGCGAGNYQEPKGLAPSQVATLLRDKILDFRTIDGKTAGGPPPSLIPFQVPEEKYRLRPGTHNVVVRYLYEGKVSVYSAEISFTAEPGKTYRVEDWPPKILDISTRYPIPQQLRVTK